MLGHLARSTGWWLSLWTEAEKGICHPESKEGHGALSGGVISELAGVNAEGGVPVRLIAGLAHGECLAHVCGDYHYENHKPVLPLPLCPS